VVAIWKQYFTGTVTVQQGVLSVANIGSVGSASSNLGAQTTAADATINIGSGGNSATLRYTGEGETTDRIINFAGTNQTATVNHSGTGVLRFTSDTTATVDGNKTLSLNGGGIADGKRAEFAGVIANPATGVTTLTKADSGRWALQATNTFTGVVNINNGFLEVSSIGNQGVPSNLGAGTTIGFGQGTANGTLEYVGSGETTDRIVNLKTGNTGGGRIDNNGTGALVFTGNTDHGGTSNDKTLTLGGTSTGFVNRFEGVINDQTSGLKVGVAKVGASTWLLAGANTYTNGTTVNGGLLLVTGDSSTATGPVTVNAPGTLGGNGTIGGTLSGDGTITPGLDGAGTLTVGPASPTGTLAVEIDDTTGDKLVSTGTLDISGTTLSVSILGGGFTQPSYLIAEGAPLTGTFASVPAGYSVNYTATTATLVQSAGDTFASWIAANPPATGFATDSDNDGLPNAVENLLGSNPNAFNVGLTQISATASSAAFQHALNPTAASDVTRSYQWSTDLTEWKTSGETNSSGTTATIVDSPPAAGVVTVTITITDGPTEKVFGRLVATQTP
jgi:fibronectin-binding autotransporter adhesin